jgi:signal transduction histidine kinase/FixJ family two-component response regulator
VSAQGLLAPPMPRTASDAVLIVDDDEAMRETLVEILEATGIPAEGVGSAAAARERHEALLPSVALVDNRLPDATGVELGATLKAQDPDLTVLLMTGYASLENAIAAVAQFDGYLTKPVPPAELVRVIRAGRESSRLRRENRSLVAELQRANRLLEASVADRTSELNGLLEMAETIAGSTELEEVAEGCLDTAVRLTRARTAGLYVHDPDDPVFVLCARRGDGALPDRMSVAEALAARDPTNRGGPDVVSLTAGGEEVGLLLLDQGVRRQRMFLSTLAASTAVAIQNALRVARERETVQRLSELARLKSTFLATVSHELRTPLAAVLTMADMLRRSGDDGDGERRARLLSQILDQARQLGVLIDDLFDAARVEFGGLRVRCSAVDVSAVAARVAAAFAAASGPLDVRMEPGLPAASADPARLQQVLTNLVGNAFKHSPAGAPVELAAQAEGDAVAVAVADAGPGIPPEFLPHLFEPFAQAEEAARRQEGLGLGLYITRGLVEAMGGSIEVESRLGEGTRFVVRLPRAAESA